MKNTFGKLGLGLAEAVACAGLLSAGVTVSQASSVTNFASPDSVVYATTYDGLGAFGPSGNTGPGFYVSTSADSSSDAEVTNLEHYNLHADSPTYSDAGIVLYFNGSLTLNNLISVGITSTSPDSSWQGSTSVPLSVNLWIDTNSNSDATDNSKFFQFASADFSTPNKLTGLGGDYYYGETGNTVNATTNFTALTSEPAGGTLAQLQSQYGNDPVAIWIGIVSTNGANVSAAIDNVAVTTVTPIPGSGFLAAVGGLALIGGLTLRRRMTKFQ